MGLKPIKKLAKNHFACYVVAMKFLYLLIPILLVACQSVPPKIAESKLSAEQAANLVEEEKAIIEAYHQKKKSQEAVAEAADELAEADKAKDQARVEQAESAYKAKQKELEQATLKLRLAIARIEAKKAGYVLGPEKVQEYQKHLQQTEKAYNKLAGGVK
jgi:multidrug efflux pump subunit AcrA (membrane-fusion protein)